MNHHHFSVIGRSEQNITVEAPSEVGYAKIETIHHNYKWLFEFWLPYSYSTISTCKRNHTVTSELTILVLFEKSWIDSRNSYRLAVTSERCNQTPGVPLHQGCNMIIYNSATCCGNESPVC